MTCRLCAVVALSLLGTLAPQTARAQRSSSPSAPAAGASTVPRSVPFNGQVTTPTGEARAGQVLLTFGLYTEQTDGTPLWTEQQVVTLDQDGRYAVILGSARADGLPADAFAAGSPKWLGVQVESEKEQPRLMLLSVPYALKAGDADTVGGKAVSEFVTASHLTDSVKSAIKESKDMTSAPNAPYVTPNALVKFINGSGGTGESSLVDSGGRLGVGVSAGSVGAELDILGGGSTTTITLRNNTGGAKAADVLKMVGSDGSVRFGSFNTSNLINLIGSNVGISTTNPQSKFHIVVGPGGVSPRVESSGTDTFAAGWDFYHGATGMGFVGVPDPSASFGAGEVMLYGAPGTKTSLWAGGTRSITIATNGNVGIGTSTPGGFGKFEVVTSSGAGVVGRSSDTYGVLGLSDGGLAGTAGANSSSGAGVYGESQTGPGVSTRSYTGNLMEGSNGGGLRKFHIDLNGTYTAGSDFAEALPARGDRSDYEPGDVLVVSTSAPGQVEKTSRPYDARVAGVYSTRPGMLGAEKGGTSRVDQDDIPVAIVGIVPTKVSTINGRIRVGDLLTTSSTPGYAMRCANRAKCVGAVVGKALEPLAGGKGVIKVLVMLR